VTLEYPMTKRKPLPPNHLASSVANAKAAYAAGKFDSYKPLPARNLGDESPAHCEAAWGPQMRR